MRLILATVLLLAASGASAQTRFGSKTLGVLLVGSSSGPGFASTVADLRKDLGTDVPLQEAVGAPNGRDLQRAISALIAARVKHIVVVPFYLRSEDPELQQTRYLLGIQKFPSQTFVNERHAHLSQSKVKRAVPPKGVALAMTSALETDEAVSDAILERVRGLGREPEREAVVLVADGPADLAARSAVRAVVERHARRVRTTGKYREVKTVVLESAPQSSSDAPPDLSKGAPRMRRDGDPMQELRETVRALSRSAKVLVVQVKLEADGSERGLRRALEGSFCRFEGKPLLPSRELTAWARKRVSEGFKLPDMVKFRDDGQAPEGAERKRLILH
ncbi:MAG: hypothetical protein WC969_10805 [Elusimicrobiota bacterium]|jgi:sirohydrochlorin ferrochelatase